MVRVIFSLLLLVIPLYSQGPTGKRYKIGVCLTAMENYDTYALSLIESGRRYFCVTHDVKYFVFTSEDTFPDAADIVKIKQSPQGWPFDILKRVHSYDEHQKLLEQMDYVFAIAANMVFVAPVGDEILAPLVAVQHPAFIRKRGAYENKKYSTAFVQPHEGKHYFSNRFYGGSKVEFLKLLKEVKKQIDADLARDFIARMQDESYLNRYFIDHPPTKILNPSYCYPTDWQLDYPKKIVWAPKGGVKK